MILIETCPECGHDLRSEVLPVNPPVRRKVCTNCGWTWTSKPDNNVMRIPFKDDIYSQQQGTISQVTLSVTQADYKGNTTTYTSIVE